MLLARRKRDAQYYNIPGIELVDTACGDKGTPETDIFYPSLVGLVFVGENNFHDIFFPVVNSLESQVVLHVGCVFPPYELKKGTIGLCRMNHQKKLFQNYRETIKRLQAKMWLSTCFEAQDESDRLTFSFFAAKGSKSHRVSAMSKTRLAV